MKIKRKERGIKLDFAAAVLGKEKRTIQQYLYRHKELTIEQYVRNHIPSSG